MPRKYNEITYDDGCIMQEPEAEESDSDSYYTSDCSTDSSSVLESYAEESNSTKNSSDKFLDKNNGIQIGNLFYNSTIYNSLVFHYSTKNIMVQFSPEALLPYVKNNLLMSPLLMQTSNSGPANAINIYNNLGKTNKLTYKMVRTESRVLVALLQSYGFTQTHPNSSDFNLMWHGGHVKPIVLRSLQDYQRVNHFPRSYELTRKDRMYANITKMQQTHGYKHFDFVAKSFVLPLEYQEFMGYYQREMRKGQATWIIKPVASSRGRGIYLANNINHIPLDENIIVSRYLDSPFLIDGFKFDIRLYVAVTSYDPVIIYLFEEGLTRFCTIKYDKKQATKNLRMHLTNYSLNKKSMDYVKCDNPNVEDYGNKWSMSAMLRYLRDYGVDTSELCARIEDVVIKTILSVEIPIATTTKMFVPNPRGNCSELYGFDILIDENLKPWVLEVNLSPSLATDSPLDLKIKSHVVADWLNLTGVGLIDSVSRNKVIKEENLRIKNVPGGRNNKQRPMTSKHVSSGFGDKDLSSEESRVIRWAKEQNHRRGGFIRIFPRPDSWDKYSRFLQYRTTFNSLLARRLFRDTFKHTAPMGIESKFTSKDNHNHKTFQQGNYSNYNNTCNNVPIVSKFARNRAMAQRLLQYERKLLTMTEIVSVKNKKVQKIRKRKKKKPQNLDLKPQSLPKDYQTTENFVDAKTGQHSKLLVKRSNQRPKTANVFDKDNKSPYETQNRQNFNKKNLKSNIKSAHLETYIADDKNGLEYQEVVYDHKHNSFNRSRGNSRDSNSNNTVNRSKLSYRSQSPDRKSNKRLISVNNSKEMNSSSQEKIKSFSTSLMSISNNAANANIRIKAKKIYQQFKLSPPSLENFLTAIEARKAFHAYLCKVQIRLTKEANYSNLTTNNKNFDKPEQNISEQKQENHLNLVTKFLIRAADNLPQPINITIPNKDQYNLITRKKLVSSQLALFVSRYQAETTRQQNLMSPKHELKSEKNTPKQDFDFFIKNATESELEDVLTLYTTRNKSAAIFLGTKPAPKIKSIEIKKEPNLTTSEMVHKVGPGGDNLGGKEKIQEKTSFGCMEIKNQEEIKCEQAPKPTVEMDITDQSNVAPEPKIFNLNKQIKPNTNSYMGVLKHRPASAATKTKLSNEEQKFVDALNRLNFNGKISQTDSSGVNLPKKTINVKKYPNINGTININSNTQIVASKRPVSGNFYNEKNETERPKTSFHSSYKPWY